MSYAVEDTIVAISTPLGRGGLGVVRLSGPRALSIAAALFTSRHAPLADAPSHTLHHGWLRGPDGPVDEVMVVLMRQPRSYTGEDVVEISAHGGPVLLRQIVRLCLDRGARLAERGEFTFRAFLNGKMDLARAEAVAELIASKTPLAARAALEQLGGGLSRQILEWRTLLLDTLAHLEVALDYAGEDIRFVSPEELIGTVDRLREAIGRLLASANQGRILREGLAVSIIGKPNTGKSSLLNTLLEAERSIVTDIPGTTRDIIEETLDLNGIPLVIKDTAGLRAHAADAVEKIGQQRTLQTLSGAEAVLWLVDASEPLSAEDSYIAGLLRTAAARPPVIVVLNKIDRPSRVREEDVASLLPDAAAMVALSALTRQGLDKLEHSLLSLPVVAGLAPETPVLATARHREVLERTSSILREARSALDRNEPEELLAFHLRSALDTLGEITGETTTEEILDTIFSRFCVGK